MTRVHSDYNVESVITIKLECCQAHIVPYLLILLTQDVVESIDQGYLAKLRWQHLQDANRLSEKEKKNPQK